MKKKKSDKFLTVIETAKYLGMDPQVLRVGLQRDKFPFGWAVENENGRFTYYIPKKLVKDYIGWNKWKK